MEDALNIVKTDLGVYLLDIMEKNECTEKSLAKNIEAFLQKDKVKAYSDRTDIGAFVNAFLYKVHCTINNENVQWAVVDSVVDMDLVEKLKSMKVRVGHNLHLDNTYDMVKCIMVIKDDQTVSEYKAYDNLILMGIPSEHLNEQWELDMEYSAIKAGLELRNVIYKYMFNVRIRYGTEVNDKESILGQVFNSDKYKITQPMTFEGMASIPDWVYFNMDTHLPDTKKSKSISKASFIYELASKFKLYAIGEDLVPEDVLESDIEFERALAECSDNITVNTFYKILENNVFKGYDTLLSISDKIGAKSNIKLKKFQQELRLRQD